LQPALAKATKTIISSDKHAIHQTEISVEQVKIWIFCAACQKKEYRVAEIVDEIKTNHPPGTTPIQPGGQFGFFIALRFSSRSGNNFWNNCPTVQNASFQLGFWVFGFLTWSSRCVVPC
jgi:hypothetical protein